MSVRTGLMQINTRVMILTERMNTKYLVVVAAMAAMLVAATALATDNAFADKKRHDDKKMSYKKSQAVTQINDCGNGDTPVDVSESSITNTRRLQHSSSFC
jgi:uncharacterized membrane protein